jgi:hypothetical protein
VTYALALGLTLLVELPVYALALRRRALIPALAVNLITHPLLWLALGPTPTAWAFALGELAAWTVEFGLLAAWLRRDVAMIGATVVLANALSCLAGLLIPGV